MTSAKVHRRHQPLPAVTWDGMCRLSVPRSASCWHPDHPRHSTYVIYNGWQRVHQLASTTRHCRASSACTPGESGKPWSSVPFPTRDFVHQTHQTDQPLSDAAARPAMVANPPSVPAPCLFGSPRRSFIQAILQTRTTALNPARAATYIAKDGRYEFPVVYHASTLT